MIDNYVSFYKATGETIQGKFRSMDGFITFEGEVCFKDGSLFILTNEPELDGATIEDRKGYKYSWAITTEEQFKRELSELRIIDSCKEDKALSPDHYKNHPSGFECKHFTSSMVFNLGNTFKYLWRAGNKNGESFKRDIGKAIVYLVFEIDYLESGGPRFGPIGKDYNIQLNQDILKVAKTVNPSIGLVLILIHNNTSNIEVLKFCIETLKKEIN